jgi:DNA polymerase-1
VGKYSATLDHAFLKLPNTILGVYNAHDSYYTAKLAGPLIAEVQSNGAAHWNYYQQWIEPLQYAVINMQRRGLLLDRVALRKYRHELRKELSETDELICKAAGDPDFNPNSDAQVRRLLFGRLDLKPAGKTDGGAPSVDLENLTRVLRDLRVKDEPHRELLLNLFHRSRLQTIYERYLKLEPGPDGRVRPHVKITGTKTWRFAYADPAAQQFPPEARHVFTAAPGHVFVQRDYSQVEARILAVLSGDETSLEVFRTGGDVHIRNACDLFRLSDDQWKGLGSGGKAYRNTAKSFLYGISYGGKGDTIKTKTFCPCPRCAAKVPPTLELTRPQMKVLAEQWFQKHPAVRRFQRELAEGVQRCHHYDSPFGMRRWFSKPWGSELDRELKNVPEQMNAALLMIQRQVELDRIEAPIVLQMHDSFLLEVPEARVDYWIDATRSIMEQPCPELGGWVYPTDVEVGRNWGAYDRDNPERNPDGLRAA